VILTQQQLILALRALPEPIRVCSLTIHAWVRAGCPVVTGGKCPRFKLDDMLTWLKTGKSKPRTQQRRAGDTNPNVLRQMKLKMQECRCEVCGWGASRETLTRLFNKRVTAVEMHHIRPVRDGGGDWSYNLIALCPQCHWIADRLKGITSREETQARVREILDQFRVAS
jgi:hypothetical protein